MKRAERAIAAVDIMASINTIGVGVDTSAYNFGLYDENSHLLATTTSDASGLIKFESVNFTLGVHNCVIRIISGDGSDGHDSEDDEISVTISASSGQEGEEYTKVTYPDGSATFFHRIYSDNQGVVEFPELIFYEPGEYVFYIRELPDTENNTNELAYKERGWTYDGVEYRIVITVIDDGYGNLIATSSYNNDSCPTFVNVFAAAPVTATIHACKIAIGADVPAGMFTFVLYDSDGKPVTSVSNNAVDDTFAVTNKKILKLVKKIVKHRKPCQRV